MKIWLSGVPPYPLPEDEGGMFLQNVDNHLFDHTVSQPRRPRSTFSPPSESQITKTILDKICFSDEAILNVYGTVNRPICHVWGKENPHKLIECRSVEVNM
jgi:hypothetical protein